jgi:hypothetical protein
MGAAVSEVLKAADRARKLLSDAALNAARILEAAELLRGDGGPSLRRTRLEFAILKALDDCTDQARIDRAQEQAEAE